MAPNDHGTVRDEVPGTPPASAPPAGPSNTIGTGDDRPGRTSIWAGALIAGLLSGAIGWAGSEAALDLYHISEEAAGQEFDFTQANLERRTSGARNAAIAFGLLGATLGLTLGLAGGLAGGKAGSGPVGAGAGLVLGGASGGLIPFLVVPLYFDRFDPAEPTLLLPILVQGAIWLPIGLAGGLAFGLGLGGRRLIWPALAGGLIGSAVGVAAVEVVNAVGFPLTNSDQYIPSVGPFAGDRLDWERFYLFRGPMKNAHAAGEQSIDQFQLGTATAAAQQRLIARFAMPLFIAIGVAWASSGTRRSGPKRDPGAPPT